MAKVTSPLLSLNASGTIADTLTFSRWKGIRTVRNRVIPANPKTAAQVAQRALVTAVTNFWRTEKEDAETKQAWDRDAQLDPRPLSGFNAFSSQAVRAAAEDAASSFVSGLDDLTAATMTLKVKNLDDGAAGDEAGDFELRVGVSATQMLDTATVAIAAGELIYDLDALGYAATDVVYFQVSKDAGTFAGCKRSGIYKATLV